MRCLVLVQSAMVGRPDPGAHVLGIAVVGASDRAPIEDYPIAYVSGHLVAADPQNVEIAQMQLRGRDCCTAMNPAVST